MKVSRYYSRSDVRLEEMPVPNIGPGELLVQMKACGLCGSDLMSWYTDKKAPTVLGHEPTGVVVQAGAGVEQFAPGDRVFVHHHVPCFTCHYCSRGFYTLCATFKGTHLDPGGFAEFIRVPALNVERDVLHLPDGMSFEEGALIEPVATCIRGIKRSGLQKGDTVAVLGVGVSGLTLVQLARLWGATKIVATDLVDYRLEMALRLGADHAIHAGEDVIGRVRELNAGRGADVVFVSVGHLQVMEQALALVEKGGTVLFFAPTQPGTTLPVSPHRLIFEEVTVTGTYSCTPQETRLSLKLIEAGRINVRDLITHRFDLAGVREAMDLAARAQESLKIVI
ncbi:MAG TPA: zinc-dependent dehydrogenase, partial [Anaerolineae bacterium]|nr:zinc-dependent dehydrogenase [Anaerolineae bacterium]